VAWDALDRVAPDQFTAHTAAQLIPDGNPSANLMPKPQPLNSDLIEEGHTVPVARVQAMHEGKRRERARRD
jgi:bifunctional non-homologous end joining protein LigD